MKGGGLGIGFFFVIFLFSLLLGVTMFGAASLGENALGSIMGVGTDWSVIGKT